MYTAFLLKISCNLRINARTNMYIKLRRNFCEEKDKKRKGVKIKIGTIAKEKKRNAIKRI